MPVQVRVLLLGPVDVRVGDGSVSVGGTKARAVLAQLALAAGHVVSVEQLIDGLWGDQPPATATNTLQQHIVVLRKALAVAGSDLLVTRPPGYSLAVPTDVQDFLRLRREADLAYETGRGQHAARLYAEALALWRGPALADVVTLPAGQGRAVALDAQRLACIESWAQAELASGHAEELVSELETLVALHPTRERLWEHLMVALYRTGRQADALASYARARALLDDALGVEPGPALRSTHAAVLAHDARLASPAPTSSGGLSVIATRLRTATAGAAAWLVRPDGSRLHLTDRDAVVGRQSDSDVPVRESEVSRQHARIFRLGEGHAIEDLGSTNGTRVNGAPISAITPLVRGDRIEIGSAALRYESVDS
ncbi:MAG: BTAD domain-containing putative transcriptional regulator [Mycobacteriales bacterium]